MPYATNGRDGARVCFEDQGGDGAPVILHDGFADSVEDPREWVMADVLASEGFRVILADHRGHGRSDTPHDPAAYAMPLRVADAVAILDRLRIERALRGQVVGRPALLRDRRARSQARSEHIPSDSGEDGRGVER